MFNVVKFPFRLTENLKRHVFRIFRVFKFSSTGKRILENAFFKRLRFSTVSMFTISLKEKFENCENASFHNIQVFQCVDILGLHCTCEKFNAIPCIS